MELKPGAGSIIGVSVFPSFNRTSMELKHVEHFFALIDQTSFNRTSMELKLRALAQYLRMLAYF